MKYPSINERQQFVLLTHASYAFGKVASICRHILETPVPIEDPLYHDLIVSLHTAYGRPFKESRGFGKLDKDKIVAYNINNT